MQAGGDGFGWRVTAEHMTFQDPGVFVPGHIRKVPVREDTAGSMTGEEVRVSEGERTEDRGEMN